MKIKWVTWLNFISLLKITLFLHSIRNKLLSYCGVINKINITATSNFCYPALNR